jgi:Leucine-rich repeat (LRR) protein
LWCIKKMTKSILPIIFLLLTFSGKGQKVYRNIFEAIKQPDSVEYLWIGCPHDFPNANPCDSIPEEINRLVNLKSFSGSESRFKTLPNTFNELQKLEHFGVSENWNFQPDELCKLVGLSNLKTLDLFSMNFKEIPECIGKIRSLEEVHLSIVPYLDLNQTFGVLSKLPRLHSISFDINQDSTIPTSLNKLEEIEYLYLDYNRGIKIEELLKSTKKLKLKGLSINSCGIFELPESFNQIGDLYVLSLNDNWLDSIPVVLFTMENLSYLSIAQNNGYNSRFQLTSSIGKLKSIQYLNFSHTDIGKLPTELQNLQKLEYLNIYSCKISNLVEVIPNIPNLKTLNIDSESYPKEMEILKELLPDLIIESKNIGQLEYYSVLDAFKNKNAPQR